LNGWWLLTTEPMLTLAYRLKTPSTQSMKPGRLSQPTPTADAPLFHMRERPQRLSPPMKSSAQMLRGLNRETSGDD